MKGERSRRCLQLRGAAHAFTEIHTAFGDPYQGEGDEVLLAIMDYYYDRENTGITAGTATKPYNYSLAMVQSSGMGKSRTVDMAAQKRFAFLLNLRDDGSVNHFGELCTAAHVPDRLALTHSKKLIHHQTSLFEIILRNYNMLHIPTRRSKVDWEHSLWPFSGRLHLL